MAPGKAPRRDWAPVLRRQPNEIAYGRPHGGYTQAFEIICRGCGDHVDVDYRDAPLRLQKLRGPYQLAAGLEAYEAHYAWHQVRHRERGVNAAPSVYDV